MGIATGDFVTRDGSDVHYVYGDNGDALYDSDLVEVICVIEPHKKWTLVGECESNLSRRYSVLTALEQQFAQEQFLSLIEKGELVVPESNYEEQGQVK